MESKLFKGVYQGQPGVEAQIFQLPHVSGSPPVGMTNLVKGVFRTPSEERAHAIFPHSERIYSRNLSPALTRSHSQHDQCTVDASERGLSEHDFSQESNREISQPHVSSHEGKQGIVEDLANKSLKIVFEDSSKPNAKDNPKKPDLHPQEKLDKFWNVFEPEYHGKITRVLPTSLIESSPAASKQAGDISHRTFRSYEEARSRCIRDVKRIIRECRAHNKKYTDTHFDIERDLKITGRRDCLDGLSSTIIDGSDSKDRAYPTDVKRVCEIFENPKFFASGASFDDIIQGKLGDCWLLAAFSILTCNEKLVKDVCVIQDVEIGVYGFVFYRDGDWHQCIIDDKLYLLAPSYDESGDVVLGMYGVEQNDQESRYNELFQKGSKSLYFARCRDENETWVPLLEKAFAKAHGCYAALIGGQTGEAIEDLTGGVTTEIYTTNILNKDKFWYDELRKIGTDFVFSAAAASYREWRAPNSSAVRVERRQGIVSQHAYAILDTYEGYGQRLVKMRNPWGSSEWNGPWSDGSKEWNSEWFERLNHKFGDDGIFWISYEDMLRKYKYLDRTRIFGPEWHVAQQWTSVQVPWNTIDYQQTRFRLEVPEDTEAVIVLSQLDDRYFKGLQGKYNYTLQFRIQKDDDEEDEYFSRSPHTYELVRSNNVEATLEKGRYTVLFKVEAKKTNRKDVEAVIRDNIWRKEKLMQIGALYDLAHQKGARNMSGNAKKPETDVKGGEKAEDKSKLKEELDKDANRDPWNAFCVVGCRVYSKHSNLGLKVLHPDQDEEPAPPALDRDDIAKAPLQEAQQNSEQTPEGSVGGSEDAGAEETAQPGEQVQTVDSTASTPPQPIVVEEKKPDEPKPAEEGAVAIENKTPVESIESSQIMDDLAGDKDNARGC